MSERYTDTFREIKQALDDQHEAQKLWQGTFDEKMKKIEQERAEDRERLEAMESKAIAPGRTGAPSRKAAEHRKLFDAWMRKPGDPVRLQELANYERLELKDVTIGTGSAGGFAVPEEISREIERLELQLSPVRGLVNVVQASTSDFKVLVNARGTNAAWASETGTRSASNSSELRERTPTHGELYAYVTVSNWSLDDVFFNLSAWVAEEAAQAFAVEEGDAVIRGNGTDKPTGMIDTAPVTTADFASPERSHDAYQAIESDMTPGAQGVTADSLIDLVYAVNASYRARGVFVMNSSTAAAIRKLKDDNGQYLWGAALVAGQPDRLLGYPVAVWEAMDSIGSNKYPVAFGDFRRGYVLDDIGPGLRIVKDEITVPGKTKYYLRRRVGGIPTDNHSLKWIKTV